MIFFNFFFFKLCNSVFFFNHLIFFSGRISIANLCPKELEKKIMDLFVHQSAELKKKKNWEDFKFFCKTEFEEEGGGMIFLISLQHTFT